MTTPWKTCTRSLLPSTTFTWTFRVSPAAKSGTSSRRLAWSITSVDFIWVSWDARVPRPMVWRRGPRGLRPDDCLVRAAYEAGKPVRCAPDGTARVRPCALRRLLRVAALPNSASSSPSCSSAHRGPRSDRGGRSIVRRSACARRQRATFAWSPLRAAPRAPANPGTPPGRVYCGYSSSPSEKDSSTDGLVVAHHPGYQPTRRPRAPPWPPPPRR